MVTDIYGALALETMSKTPEQREKEAEEARKREEFERYREESRERGRRQQYEIALKACEEAEALHGPQPEWRETLAHWFDD